MMNEQTTSGLSPVSTLSDEISNSPQAIATRTSVTPYGLLVLGALWAGLFAFTWATWGNLTIDCGREMYVPVALLHGETLYKDVWYLYGPISPYFNSLLFWIFGVHLSVLYWAGALAALLSGVFLFLAGIELGSWLAGVGAAAVVEVQSFESGLWSFPLPYSFASVYGCLIACLFVWLLARCSKSPKSIWIFAAGCAAAVALLLKLEYGFACYATLSTLIAFRAASRGRKSFVLDCLAVLPGIVACVFVIGWMLSLRGLDFITQENIMSWPTSYFMRRYGTEWLGITGGAVSPKELAKEAFWTIPLLAAAFFLNRVLRRVKSDRSPFMIWAPLAIFAVAGVSLKLPQGYYVDAALRRLAFPKQLVCLLAVAACVLWVRLWRNQADHLKWGGLVLVLTFSSLLAFRIPTLLLPTGYSIYYDGPAILCFLLLAAFVIPRSGRSRLFIERAELLIVSSTLAAAILHASPVGYQLDHRIPLVTEAGVNKVPEAMFEGYKAAIEWMESAKAHGKAVLSLPEDTSLYFLSGTNCPTRMIEFTPGIVAPGRITQELIAEIEGKQIPYLLWSNREYPEYGTPVFGTDYNRDLGDYFRTHYRPLFPLTSAKAPAWNAVVWERLTRTER